MAYIGNPPADKYSKLAKQDLTGGSGTGFTLDYAVGSVAEIEVFVNHVRQEPTTAYTVAGDQLTMTGTVASTDDFYVVFQGKAIASGQVPEKQSDGSYVYLGDVDINGNELILDADADSKIEASTDDTINIISGGTTGLTMDSSGIVDMPATVMYDTYRLTADFTTNGTLTAWEQPDNTIMATVGDSMSVSSGIFTFPRTGIYRVTFFGLITNASGDNTTTLELFATTDNSTYSRIVYSWEGNAGTTTDHGTLYGEAVLNISDTSNRKVKLEAGSTTSPSQILGHTDQNRTYVSFQYLAPST